MAEGVYRERPQPRTARSRRRWIGTAAAVAAPASLATRRPLQPSLRRRERDRLVRLRRVAFARPVRSSLVLVRPLPPAHRRGEPSRPTAVTDYRRDWIGTKTPAAPAQSLVFARPQPPPVHYRRPARIAAPYRRDWLGTKIPAVAAQSLPIPRRVHPQPVCVWTLRQRRPWIGTVAAAAPAVVNTRHFRRPSPAGGLSFGSPNGGIGIGTPSGGIGAGTPSALVYKKPSPSKVSA